MLALVDEGMHRDEAHEALRTASMLALERARTSMRPAGRTRRSLISSMGVTSRPSSTREATWASAGSSLMLLCKGPGPSSRSRCNQEPRRQVRLMIEGTESVHLVHGPGSDAEALCLQISRGYLESDRVVAWIGDLAPALARPIIGSLGEASLENLRILDRGVKGIEGSCPGAMGSSSSSGGAPRSAGRGSRN